MTEGFDPTTVDEPSPLSAGSTQSQTRKDIWGEQRVGLRHLNAPEGPEGPSERMKSHQARTAIR